jgi:hypothetical protein
MALDAAERLAAGGHVVQHDPPQRLFREFVAEPALERSVFVRACRDGRKVIGIR